MLTEKQKQLGWIEGGAADFLGLSKAEEQLVNIKIALSDAVREARQKEGLTQKELAARLGVKQPNVVRLETGTASLDLILHALLELGVSPRKIARLISGTQEQEEDVAAVAVRKPAGRVTLKGQTKSRREAVTAS